MRETTLSDVERAAADEALLPMDEESFRRFYERTARPVWAYLARMTADRQLADDLLQETYYRFLRAGAVHESESHRRNSLFVIATNLARDSHRRGQQSQHVPLPEDDESGPSSASSAEDRADLARAFSQLRPQQREMLWLAYAHGSTHAEIAEAVGVKTGSVKPLLFRARKKLAALLGKEGR